MNKKFFKQILNPGVTVLDHGTSIPEDLVQRSTTRVGSRERTSHQASANDDDKMISLHARPTNTRLSSNNPMVVNWPWCRTPSSEYVTIGMPFLETKTTLELSNSLLQKYGRFFKMYCTCSEDGFTI